MALTEIARSDHDRIMDGLIANAKAATEAHSFHESTVALTIAANLMANAQVFEVADTKKVGLTQNGPHKIGGVEE